MSLLPSTDTVKTHVTSKLSPYKAKQRVKLGKRVRFVEQPKKIIVRPEAEYEDWTSWYHPIEYKQFQLEARRTLLALLARGNDPSSLDPSEHCLRGLEKHQVLPEVRAMYKQQNRQFVRLIVCEHTRLRREGVTDPETLQAISTMYTNPAKEYAFYLANHSE